MLHLILINLVKIYYYDKDLSYLITSLNKVHVPILTQAIATDIA